MSCCLEKTWIFILLTRVVFSHLKSTLVHISYPFYFNLELIFGCNFRLCIQYQELFWLGRKNKFQSFSSQTNIHYGRSMVSQGKTHLMGLYSFCGEFHWERPLKSCKLKFEGSLWHHCRSIVYSLSFYKNYILMSSFKYFFNILINMALQTSWFWRKKNQNQCMKNI